MDVLPPNTTWKDIMIGVIAVYGAALSTFTYFSSTRRRLQVVLSNAITESNVFMIVRATNTGSRPVTINYLTLELPDRRTLMPGQTRMPDTRLPVTLADGQSSEAYFDTEIVLAAVRRAGYQQTIILRGFATDSAGKKYRSPTLKIDLSTKE